MIQLLSQWMTHFFTLFFFFESIFEQIIVNFNIFFYFCPFLYQGTYVFFWYLRSILVILFCFTLFTSYSQSECKWMLFSLFHFFFLLFLLFCKLNRFLDYFTFWQLLFFLLSKILIMKWRCNRYRLRRFYCLSLNLNWQLGRNRSLSKIFILQII